MIPTLQLWSGHISITLTLCVPTPPTLSLSRHPVVFPKQLLDHKVVDILLSLWVSVYVLFPCFLMFLFSGFYFSLVGGHYKKIPQLRGPLEAIKCIFMLQAAVCFLCELFQLSPFFWYPRYVYLICQMPNETFYDEFCDPKNQIPQLPRAYMYLPFHPRWTPCYSVTSSFPFVEERRSIFHISIYEA